MKKLFWLLVFAAGCGKKESEPAPVVPALTCVVDGVPATYKNAPYVILQKGYAAPAGSHAGDDALFVIAENGTGQAFVQVTFTKDFGSPDANYKLYGIICRAGNTVNDPTYNYGNGAGSIHPTATGGWSGTFSGDRVYFVNTTMATASVTQGVFTEARPQ